MKTLQFLKQHKIEFLPLLIKVNSETGKKDMLLTETQMILGYIPTMKDFMEKSATELHRRQEEFILNYDRHCEMADQLEENAYWVFGIDTHYIFIMDVDDPEAMPVVEKLLQTHPYYLSTSKHLPKIFFKDSNLAAKPSKNLKYMNKMVEVQKGQWSFLDVEGSIVNQEKDIPLLDFEAFIAPHDVKPTPKKPRIMLEMPLQREVAEKLEVPLCFIQHHRTFKLCECLSQDRWDDWETWFKIGCALKNEQFSYSFHVWKYFSMGSEKYDDENWLENGKDKTTWDNIKIMDGGITLGTLHHWAKEDNLELYSEYFGKSYDKVKARIEKILFKVNSPPVFGVLDVDNKLSLLSEEKLKTRFRDVWYEKLVLDKKTGEKNMEEFTFINAWLFDPDKRCYEKIIFNPRPHTDPRMYNIYSPTVLTGEYHQDHVDTILKYMLEKLCGGDEAFQKFMVLWLAHIVQKPWDKTRVCLVIKSIQGVGKGIFTNFFGNKILGEKYYVSLERMTAATGRFNNTLENKLFVNLNEVEMKDTMESQGLLKAYITDDTFQLERKNIDRITIGNHMNFIATTNKDSPFVIEFSDRRFACVESGAGALTNDEITYYTDFFKQPDVAYSFHQFLLSQTLPPVRLEKIRPETEYYRDCKVVVASPVLKFLAQDMEQSHLKDKYFMSYESLYARYKDYIQQFYHTDKKIINLSTFKLKLKDIKGIEKERRVVEGERVRGVEIHTQILRQHLHSLHLYED